VYDLLFLGKKNFSLFLVRVPPFLVKKEKKKFSHPSMTIHTPIESPCRDDKRYAVLKIIYSIIRPKNAENPLKCQKIDFLKLKKKSEKKVKTQMCTKFFRDLHLIS
jgi:hypothetical protein